MVKVSWDGMVIEGTPEEVRETLALMRMTSSEHAVAGRDQASQPDNGEEEIEYVSYDVARTALTRIPLHAIQKKLFKAIYDAHPRRILATELQSILGYERPQFSGLMGALGRRFTHTQGYIAGTNVFDQEWDYERHCYDYSLPPTVKRALEDLGVVGAAAKGHTSGK